VPLKIAFALLAIDRQYGMWPEAPATGQGVPRPLSVISPSKKHHLTQHRLSWVEQASRRSECIATTCACAIRLRVPGSLCQVRGMHPNQSKLESRVHRAAEAALSRQKYVSAIDVLCGMGLLATPHVDDWRKGRVDFLERVIQANLSKISSSMAIFAAGQGRRVSSPAKPDMCVTHGAHASVS
jgi:hypothetical protein